MSAHACDDCGLMMRVRDTAHFDGKTFRKLECPCGQRFETIETRSRRLSPVAISGNRLPLAATRSNPLPPIPTNGNPSPPVGGGVGGGLPSGTDPIRVLGPDPVVSDHPDRARARSNRRTTAIEYGEVFEAEWAKTHKVGSKDNAYRAWVKLGKPAFGDSWVRWTQSPAWSQDWYHYPHVATWLNDGRFKQDPSETRAKPAQPDRRFESNSRGGVVSVQQTMIDSGKRFLERHKDER